MHIIKTLIVPFLLLAVWQIFSGMVSPYLLPAPGQVLQSGIILAQNGILAKHLSASLERIIVGFSLSVTLGLGTAGILHGFSWLDKLCSGSLSFIRMTPPLALTPLLILWLGIEDATQISVIILASFFPVYLNTRAGLSRLDAAFQELAESLHISRLRYVLYFLIPAATPSIITGLRLSFGYCWRALIAAELIAASSGLGYMIMDAEQMQRADEVIVGIIIIGFTGWMLDAAFTCITSHLLCRRFPEVQE
jgi:ABC-type nitrate/sulfonate/bicarbonate transport system permease component